MTIVTLKKRKDFLKASRSKRCSKSGLTLLARKRLQDNNDNSVRVGFTCSKRLGGAVKRNRAKRRLREAARLVLPNSALNGWDYVLIGIPNKTIDLNFSTLIKELDEAIKKVHRHPHRPRRKLNKVS